jgi:hypothetical protein
VKIKRYDIELHLSPRGKRWLLWIGVAVLVLGTAAVIFAARSDRNVANRQDQRMYRQIARAQGVGPNDSTVSGAIASRLIKYTKAHERSGLQITWTDNFGCRGSGASCEWEIRIDGVSCKRPGPLLHQIDNDAGNSDVRRAETVTRTCFEVSAGPHTIQGYVKAPATNPPGGPGAGVAGVPSTGWNAGYWSLEVEEVHW